MRIVIEPVYEQMSRTAAAIVADLVQRKPNCVLGLATGSTPVGLYRELIRLSFEEDLDFSNVTTFNLDEYFRLSPEHDQSYRYFMEKNLFERLKTRPKTTHVPDGKAKDVSAHCASYEQAIQDAGGIDLQVLGIGGDGHIAFNEPGSSLGSRTRLVVLNEETIQDNARFFAPANEVPRCALTMGVATILETRCCLLLASGVKKAKVVAQAVEGPISSQITASALQMHPNTIAILDEEAADALELKDHYKHVQQVLEELQGQLCTAALCRQ